ncbi:MAG: T9SS type A sorting domain-containing protein, partial [Flavobacterium sp.]|nr:T9SS type A sorting domain-containing protein [Flavobacterium sp.]
AQCDQSSAILENSLSYTNSGYTGSCPSNYVNAFGYTSPANWYKVTIFPGATSISINLCSGTNYDSFVDVLDPSGVRLAYNDDYCAYQSQLNNVNTVGFPFVYVVVTGYFGNSGNYGITITQNLPPANGVTNVQNSQCNTTLPDIDTYVFANLVSQAQGYRFKVTNNSTSNITTKDEVLRNHKMSSDVGFKYDQAYTVEVAVKRAGVWENYGSACTITTPSVTTQIQASQCGAPFIAPTDYVYADLVKYAKGYKFHIHNFSTGEDTYLEKLIRVFRANNIPNYQSNTYYSVEVAVKNTDDTYLPYGNLCFINSNTAKITPNAIKNVANSVDNFSAVAYPNPFDTNVYVDIKSQTSDPVEIIAYDMLGRTIETMKVDLTNNSIIEIGNNYPVGVYTIVVKQQDNIQNIRVIKR